MWSQDLSAVTFLFFVPMTIWTFQSMHARTEWFVAMLWYAPVKTAVLVVSLLKFLWIISETLTESGRAKGRPSVAEMILLQLKASKIWPGLIVRWGLEGGFSGFDLCVKAEQGMSDWESWEEMEGVLLRFYRGFVGLQAARSPEESEVMVTWTGSANRPD